jgi:hypothetical protein
MMLEEVGWIAIGLVVSVLLYRTLARRPTAPSTLAMLAFGLAVWLILFWVQKIVSWQVWGSRGFSHGYGGDKAMSNLVLEPVLVLALTFAVGLIARWWAGSRFSGRSAATVASAVATLVVAAVPAIPD